jgi:hypothetical protein
MYFSIDLISTEPKYVPKVILSYVATFGNATVIWVGGYLYLEEGNDHLLSDSYLLIIFRGYLSINFDAICHIYLHIGWEIFSSLSFAK